jgi:hypothetical protein
LQRKKCNVRQKVDAQHYDWKNLFSLYDHIDPRGLRGTYHTDFGLFAGAGRADQGLELVSDPLVLLQDLGQLLDKVLGLAGVRQIPYKHTHGK